MNTQDVFVKVSSFVESQINLVNSAMHELDKDQCANCNVHTGLIVDRQDSSCSKIIAPPSLSVSITITIGNYCLVSSIKNYCPAINSTFVTVAGSVSETSSHSWFVKPKREKLNKYFKFHPHQSKTTKLNSKNLYF